MKISDIFESGPFGWGSEKPPKKVVRSNNKPKKVKPSPYGYSKHPYQHRLVGEEKLKK